MAKAWKELERRVAIFWSRIFPEAKRNPLSGSVDDSTHADVKNMPIYIEAKHSGRVPFHQVYLKSCEQARKEGKDITVVHFHSKGSPIIITMMSQDDLDKLMVRYGESWPR